MQVIADRPEAPSAIRTNLGAIFASLELSHSTWLITSLSPGSGEKMSKHVVHGGDTAGLLQRFAQLREKAVAQTGRNFPIIVIHEAGLDGFWIDRVLKNEGIESHVVDPASVATSRRRRRAKTDKIDGEALVRTLLAYKRGEPPFFARSWPDLLAGILPVRSTQIATSLKNISRHGSGVFLPTWRSPKRLTFTRAWVCWGERSSTLKRRHLPCHLEYQPDRPCLEKSTMRPFILACLAAAVVAGGAAAVLISLVQEPVSVAFAEPGGAKLARRNRGVLVSNGDLAYSAEILNFPRGRSTNLRARRRRFAMKRIMISAIAFVALIGVVFVLRSRPASTELAASTAAMPSLLELHTMAGANKLPTQEMEDQSLVYPTVEKP